MDRPVSGSVGGGHWLVAMRSPYEDQAERAVRSGLEAVRIVAELHLGENSRLAARSGIATGQVVVGDLVGETGRQADVHCLKGEILQYINAGSDERELCFRQAMACAAGQDARLMELRSALSLARLLRDQGRAQEARDVLEAIYSLFEEGFETPDLMAAKVLLDELP